MTASHAACCCSSGSESVFIRFAILQLSAGSLRVSIIGEWSRQTVEAIRFTATSSTDSVHIASVTMIQWS